jgi:Icc-related predicted phosphoesterase
MRIVAVSDTHGLHRQLELPEADMLIHCGDITMKGEWKIYNDFLNWIQDQKEKYKYVVVICGNHDHFHQQFASMLSSIDVVYLENWSKTIEGIKFHGCPNVSNLPRWAFDDSKDPTCWDRIPDDVEVLITHSPPVDFLDEIWHYGSSKLRKRVDDLMDKKLKVNVFGHCHADGGKQMIIKNKEGRDVKFVNAASCDVMYKLTNPPMMFDI